jgi:hypothetical protein
MILLIFRAGGQGRGADGNARQEVTAAQYKHCRGAFKTRAAAQAIAARRTVHGIASVQEVHLSQVGKWKAEVLARLRIECPN